MDSTERGIRAAQLGVLVNALLALAKLLAGFNVHATPESGDKVTRFSPFSAQAEAGNVLVLRAPWNEDWFSSLEGFPEAAHDDDADSTSRAFNALINDPTQAAMFLTSRHRG